MKNLRCDVLTLTLAIMILASTIAVFRANAQSTWQGYVKPSFPDYAPSGMPDFDEKQDQWGPVQGTYTWCVPVAVANSLWWLDSQYESKYYATPVPPPTVSDHFPLVTAYNTTWDDHAPQNVDPLVRNLALLMDTDGQSSGDGHKGTRWPDAESGIKQFLTQQGIAKYFEVHNSSFPDFAWLSNETLTCQDVEIFLEFKQYDPLGGWMNFTQYPSFEMGHCVTSAGVNSSTGQLLISDPWQDAYEAGLVPGLSPVAHPAGHNSAVHNDVQYVSQDAYLTGPWMMPPPPPPGYPPTVLELKGYLQTMGFGPSYHAFIRAAVATSPQNVTEWQGYVKPAFPDYAPSGMPDFDQKQDQWGPVQGAFTWCGPVAAANSLWWLDSEYESLVNPGVPVPPPTISDHFNLVTSYGQWDDHDSKNVDLLVRNLATLMDTDGQQTSDGHTGTRWQDLESGIKQYLIQQGMAGMFEVHNQTFPEFVWIENETEVCQDVEIFLEFWELTQTGWKNNTITNPSLEFGHFVTCAGVNSSTFELLISDPYQDAYEAGTAPKGGRSPAPHAYPHATTIHNDTLYVSQDAYAVAQYPLPGPYGLQPICELVGYLQTMGAPPTLHAFIKAAVATSPAAVHDVAVTNLTTCKDGCKPMRTICQNYTAHVNVTVVNQGNVAESFNVTAKANTTVIGTQNVVNLGAGNQTIVTFVWNTTAYSIGNYTLSAYAAPVLGETNIGNNNCTGGIVKVVIVGDINGDNQVNIVDVSLVAKAFGRSLGQLGYNPNGDINDDHQINIWDVSAAAKRFGAHYP